MLANGAFKDGIDSLSKRSSKDHTYTRPDLSNLSHYLSDVSVHRFQPDHKSITPLTSQGNAANDFALIHDIKSGDTARFAASSTGLEQFAAHDAPPGSSLLFLRGFASPQWLNAVGETHHPSPEFYRRHLDFPAFTSGSRDLYSSPSLPSSSARVFQLTIPTICTRNVGVSGYEPEDLQQARRSESEAMTRYFKQLRSKANVADSIVRKCLTLSKQEYVIEQTITIEVGPPGHDWRAIVWLDSGEDLSRSVQGPWNPQPGTRPWETYFFPVIVHQVADRVPQRPRRSTSIQPSPSGFAALGQTSRINQMPDEAWSAAQNICLLPFQYGSCLDRHLASQDALYALSELFRFASSAEVQFLNLLHRRIEHELSFVGVENIGQRDSVSLLNLKYIQMQLASHAQSLAEVISILRNRHSIDWPCVGSDSDPDNENKGRDFSDNSHDVATVERTAILLLTDFEYLLQRAESLAHECEQGIATLANVSVLQESRHSADMAMTVQRLTVIGTIFIPLSFVCSVWGMNFRELGTGSQPLWMWFATMAPVILVAYLVYRWDFLMSLYTKIERKNPV